MVATGCRFKNVLWLAVGGLLYFPSIKIYAIILKLAGKDERLYRSTKRYPMRSKLRRRRLNNRRHGRSGRAFKRTKRMPATVMLMRRTMRTRNMRIIRRRCTISEASFEEEG